MTKSGAKPLTTDSSNQVLERHQLDLSCLGKLSAPELLQHLRALQSPFELSSVLSWQRIQDQQIIGIISPWRCSANLDPSGQLKMSFLPDTAANASLQSAAQGFEAACAQLYQSGHFYFKATQAAGFTPKVFVRLSYDVSAQELSARTRRAQSPAFDLIVYSAYLVSKAQGWVLEFDPESEFNAHGFAQRLAGLAKAKNSESNAPVNGSPQGEVERESDDQQGSNCSVEKMHAKELSSVKTDTRDFMQTACWSFDQYKDAFEQVQHYLLAGDAYQVNLAQRLKLRVLAHSSPFTLTQALDQATCAPYAGGMIAGESALISCSPELFLTFKREAKSLRLISSPIKGTRPRGLSAEQDLDFEQELETSEKDRAENLMIVDLLRHDLGRLCKTGSVKVDELFKLHSFAQVHHLISTISGELRGDLNPLQALFDASPGGSITGAPKKRAVEIIDELEVGPRGNYCGSIGFIDAQGNANFNLMIRTAELSEGELELWAGGGITVASSCAEEYQECFDKISGMLSALAPHLER